MRHGGERDPVRHAQLGEHVPQAGCWRVRRAVQPPGRATVRQSPATSSDTARSIAVRLGGPPALRVYTSFRLASRGLARVLARCRIATRRRPPRKPAVCRRDVLRPGWSHAYLPVDIPIRQGGAPQRGQPRDWRHRGMGKGLVSERDLNPHVCDLRLCVAGPYQEAYNRRSGACMCVRGPSAPKYQCVLTSEFFLDAAGGAR